MRVTLLLLLFVVSALGQSVDSPCELEPEVKEASRSWDQMDDAVVPYRERYERRLKLVQGLLKKYPHDIDLVAWIIVKGGVNLDHFGGAKVDQLVKG